MTPTRSLSLLFTMLSVSAGAAPAQEDWPRWRGDRFDDRAAATGVFDGPLELRVAWRRDIGSGYSGISVRDGRLVTLASSDGDDHVIALDAKTGAPLWRRRIATTYPGRDGAQDGPCGTPTISSDTVFTIGPFGHLLALDLSTGEERWSTHLVDDHDARRPHWGFTTAPLLVDDVLIVQVGGPEGRAFAGFDAATGAIIWEAGTDVVDYQSPMLLDLLGERLVLCTGESKLFGVHPRTGSIRFEIPHDGEAFYAKVLNPLLIAPDTLFLKQSGTRSKLVQLMNDSDDEPWLEGLWITRHIKQNYNQPVHHEGYLYGHNSSILTCIDASTGERMWRSRPPGNGWLFLLDGHLVVLTKSGSLSIHPATPDGYEELARTDLFERTSWTPPVFADGRIYARESFSELACVDIVPIEREPTPTDRSPVTLGARITELRHQLEQSSDKPAVIDAFIEDQAGFPIIEDGTIAHFIYRGDAVDVAIDGDMLEDGETVAMTRIPETDLFFRSFELEADARIGYAYVIDTDRRMADPLNPTTTATSSRLIASDLEMPGRAQRAPDASAERDSGRFEEFSIETPVIPVGGLTWGGARQIRVLLPPEYDVDDERRYPVLYVNDGTPAQRLLELPRLIDELRGRTAKPVIAVFVPTTSGYELARSQRTNYRALFLEDIVASVDERYRTDTSARARGIFGFVEGAYAALHIGLSRPDMFGFIGAQSLYHGSMQGDEELRRLVNAASERTTVYLSWGRYDSRNQSQGRDTRQTSASLAELMRARRFIVLGGEAPDGDTFACWGARLPALLESFSRLSSDE